MTGQPIFWRIAHRLGKLVFSRFFIDQWVILAGHADYNALDWKALHPLLPPRDRYWADPFILRRDDCYYVFIEDMPYATSVGRIACLTLDNEGKLLAQQTVLERPYHLSYPFLFEQEGQLFMIPESAAHRTIELYRCTHFPDRWEFVMNLMTDVRATDATLLEHDGRFWLFANVKAPGGSSLDALHLYHSSKFPTERWQPHPLNPVVHDISSARPAGRIFMDGEALIRPSQDSSRRYGYRLKFNRITALSETEYAEQPIARFTPRGRYLATHTFNRVGDLTVVDAVMRRRKK